MADDVETARRNDVVRERPRGVWIDNRSRRAQKSRRNARLRLVLCVVEDGNPRALTARTRRRWTSNVDGKRFGNGPSTTEWRWDVFVDFSRICRKKKRSFAGVDDRTTTHRHVTIEATIAGKRSSIAKRFVRWFHENAVVNNHLATRFDQGFARVVHEGQTAQTRIGEERHAPSTECAHLRTNFTYRAGAERDRGHVHGERSIAVVTNREAQTTSHAAMVRRFEHLVRGSARRTSAARAYTVRLYEQKRTR